MNYPLHRIIYTTFGLLFFAFLFMSYSNNAPTGNTGAPGEGSCSGCHSGNFLGMDGDIQILGIPASIDPSTTYPLSVIVSNPDGISLRAGFTMTALDAAGNKAGTLSNASAGSTISSGFREYFGHNPAKAYDANRQATWTVDWTSPATPANEVITFYANGNITDNNSGSNTQGDYVVSTTTSGTISGGAPTGSDLTVSNLVGWNATYMPGDVVEFNFDINNTGNTMASGDYNIMSYLSTDAFFDASDISVGDLVTGNTGIGSIPNITGAIAIPPNLAPGNYYLIIFIDALGVINELDETNNILVSQIASTVQSSVPLFGSFNVSNVSCFGDTDGAASATATGGTQPYMYQWQNGMTTQAISGLAAGDYPFTITDTNGNSVNDIASVTQPNALTASVSTIDVQCANDTNGSANASITGGTLPYTMSWSAGTNVGLAAGNYIVTITDNNGCQTIENYTINANDNTPPSVVLDQATTISLDANGQATISSSVFDDNSSDNCGGTVTFNASQVNFTCADLGTQNIDLEVTDDSGNAVTVNAVAAIVDNIAPDITCPTVSVTGCSSNIDYPLPTVSDNCSQNIVPTLASGLPSGSSFPVGDTQVVYEAADASGNVSNCFFNVSIPNNNLVADVAVANVSCFGVNDGSVNVTVEGGSPPYSYTWSNNLTGPSNSNLPAGIYMISILDGNGCEVSSSVEVVAPSELTVNVDLTNEDMGTGNGFIFITVSGGTAGYTYSWSDANNNIISTEEDPQNLTEGIYTVVVTDANGCTQSSMPVTIGIMVDVDEINLENAIQIYPNPTTGFLTINLDSNSRENIAFQIVDQNGKLVYNNNQLDNLNQVVDLTHLQNGLYWCKFMVDSNIAVKKIIIAK